MKKINSYFDTTTKSKSLSYWINCFIFSKLQKNNLNPDRQKLKIPVIYSNDFIGNHVSAFGFYEEEILDVIFKFFKSQNKNFKKGIALDIGANIGGHSIYFSKFFKKVYAFEPHPITFRINQLNTENIRNIKTFKFGLGEKKKKTILYENNVNKGSSSIINRKEYVASTQKKIKFNIDIRKLDDIKIDFQKILLIKIDAEGCESLIINGGLKVIRKNLPIILFEQHIRDFDKDENKIIKELRQLQYNFFIHTKGYEGKSLILKRIFNIKEFFFGKKHTIIKSDKIPKNFYQLLIAVPQKNK